MSTQAGFYLLPTEPPSCYPNNCHELSWNTAEHEFSHGNPVGQSVLKKKRNFSQHFSFFIRWTALLMLERGGSFSKMRLHRRLNEKKKHAWEWPNCRTKTITKKAPVRKDSFSARNLYFSPRDSHSLLVSLFTPKPFFQIYILLLKSQAPYLRVRFPFFG